MSFAATESHYTQVPVLDAVKALAFVGDLSMGQPIGQSARTAWLVAQLAEAIGMDNQVQTNSVWVALLRWSGCTANSPEFAELMGDDVGGRLAMLVAGLPAHLVGRMGTVAQIHCEVSGDVARTLGLPQAVEHALRCIFETLDGAGQPQALTGSEVPVAVQLVQTAGLLEIHSRVHGLENARVALEAMAGRLFPHNWLQTLRSGSVEWLRRLDRDPSRVDELALTLDAPSPAAPLELIADVIDLKLPWMTGFSRRVAATAVQAAVSLDLSPSQCRSIHRAALIHGLGRASVPNEIWNHPELHGEAATERLRLVPYWTARAARRIGNLEWEANLASYTEERLDGSGAFRGASGDAIGVEGRVLAAAAHWQMLQTSRPGRPGLNERQATLQMREEADCSRLDAQVVAAITGNPRPPAIPSRATIPELLSSREVEVLRRISLGESNKEAARTLGISPSTVRTHLENIFRKLGCTTRAAATLKALTAGLL